MSRRSPYAPKPDHSTHLWALFLRKTPKAIAELIYVCDGGAAMMLIAQKKLAEHHKVPVRKIEVCGYKPTLEVEP